MLGIECPNPVNAQDVQIYKFVIGLFWAFLILGFYGLLIIN
jgi:hypothetical protein